MDSIILSNPLAGIITPSQSPVVFSKPCSSFGYTRGQVFFLQDLAGPGAGYGPDCGGIGEFSQGEGIIPTTQSIFTPGFCMVMAIGAVIIISCFMHDR